MKLATFSSHRNPNFVQRFSFQCPQYSGTLLKLLSGHGNLVNRAVELTRIKISKMDFQHIWSSKSGHNNEVAILTGWSYDEV